MQLSWWWQWHPKWCRAILGARQGFLVLACWGQRTPSQESKFGRAFYKARTVISVPVLFGSDKGYYHGVLRRGYWNNWTHAFHHESMMDGWHVSYSYTRWSWHYLDVFTMWFPCITKGGALLHCIGVWRETTSHYIVKLTYFELHRIGMENGVRNMGPVLSFLGGLAHEHGHRGIRWCKWHREQNGQGLVFSLEVLRVFQLVWPWTFGPCARGLVFDAGGELRNKILCCCRAICCAGD